MSLREKLFSFNVELPLERASTLPSEWYFDPEIYHAEIKHTFLRNWIWAGRLDALSEPGSFFTLDIGPEPVLVSKDKEGLIRAVSNVCRHRAARVVSKPCGKASFFQCRYHGWTYDLSGRLKGTPEFDGVEQFFREELFLPPWKVSTFGNYVFVNAAESPFATLSDFLFPFSDRLSQLGTQNLSFWDRRIYDLKCNWKVFVDNYLDGGYHVNTLHPGLAGVIDYSKYRTEIARNTSVQISPLKKEPKDANIADVRSGEAAYYWWVYPNLMLNVYDGLMDLNWVVPTGPETCRVIFDFYFADTQSNLAKERIGQSMAVAHQIQLEDIEICEEVQRNLRTRSFDTGRFSVKREIGGHHFHLLLARELQSLVGG